MKDVKVGDKVWYKNKLTGIRHRATVKEIYFSSAKVQPISGGFDVVIKEDLNPGWPNQWPEESK